MGEFTEHVHDHAKFNIELDTEHCTASEEDEHRMRVAIAPLKEVLEDFPHVDLYTSIRHHPRSTDYHVRVSVILPGATLFTGDADDHMLPAFNRCVRKLVRKVHAYKHELDSSDEKRKVVKGTSHDVAPTQQVTAEKVEHAIRTNDYNAFRIALFPFEEPVRKRVGRWIQRYPEVNAALGEGISVADIVEEVFLNAFEQYPDRPDDILLGDWLESLIDPSVQAIRQNPEQELDNISFARTARGADY